MNFDRLKSDGTAAGTAIAEERAIPGEDLWAPPATLAGVTVSPDTALTLSAAFACINVIGTDVACLDFSVYRRRRNGSKVPAPDHPSHELIHTSPDGDRTAVNFRQAMMGHTLGWGNGYSEIKRKGSGKPYRLDPLDPATTRPRRVDGRLGYDVEGGMRWIPAVNVLHVAGLGYDGLVGYSPIRMARQAVALGLAAEAFGATFFGNGTQPHGFIKLPQKLKPEGRENLRDSWNTLHQGPYNAHKVAILEQGAEWVPTSIPPEDAQFLATRQFQVLEICRLYRVPPHKVCDLSHAHLANVEESNADYLMTTLLPWLVVVEAQHNLKLFTRAERAAGFFVEHDMRSLLRGNMAARATYYKEMFAMGVLSVDEIRRMETLNPIGKKAGGNKRFVPMNIMTLDQAGGLPTPGAGDTPTADAADGAGAGMDDGPGGGGGGRS